MNRKHLAGMGTIVVGSIRVIVRGVGFRLPVSLLGDRKQAVRFSDRRDSDNTPEGVINLPPEIRRRHLCPFQNHRHCGVGIGPGQLHLQCHRRGEWSGALQGGRVAHRPPIRRRHDPPEVDKILELARCGKVASARLVDSGRKPAIRSHCDVRNGGNWHTPLGLEVVGCGCLAEFHGNERHSRHPEPCQKPGNKPHQPDRSGHTACAKGFLMENSRRDRTLHHSTGNIVPNSGRFPCTLQVASGVHQPLGRASAPSE